MVGEGLNCPSKTKEERTFTKKRGIRKGKGKFLNRDNPICLAVLLRIFNEVLNIISYIA